VTRIHDAAVRKDWERLSRWVVDERGQPASIADIEAAAEHSPLPLVSQNLESATVSARYTLANGADVVVERKQGEFRVRLAPLLQNCPAHVVDALKAFRSAVDARAYSNTMTPFTERIRTELEAEARTTLEGLRYLEELEVVQVGREAQVKLPSGHVIRLAYQHECWLVDEVY
jgi:hypothetical protein